MLLQAIADNPVRDFIQYIADAAALGAFGFAWRTNTRVTRLETVLAEPDLGVIPSVTHLRKASTGVHNQLAEHGTRLDGHDREIDDIKDDRRHFVRRSSDRAREPGR